MTLPETLCPYFEKRLKLLKFWPTTSIYWGEPIAQDGVFPIVIYLLGTLIQYQKNMDQIDYKEELKDLYVARNVDDIIRLISKLIKSPEFFEDLDTGNKREVDISIKYKVGSVPILITVECRDRNNKDDCTWIEQLASKKSSVGADKTVAVSAAGFSEPALAKAKRLGIETRTLKKLKPKDTRTGIDAKIRNPKRFGRRNA